MSKNKYYAVKVGRNTGVYTSWPECEKQVKGYNGAVYKSFSDINDAKDYLGITVEDNNVYLYTDGSYNSDDNKYSYAFAVIRNNKMLYHEAECKEDITGMQNVAGELVAMMRGLLYCKAHDLNVIVCHDYIGVYTLVSGDFKAKNKFTQKYIEYMNQLNYSRNIIEFKHIQGHSNNKWNDYVDELAKQAFNYNVGV